MDGRHDEDVRVAAMCAHVVHLLLTAAPRNRTKAQQLRTESASVAHAMLKMDLAQSNTSHAHTSGGGSMPPSSVGHHASGRSSSGASGSGISAGAGASSSTSHASQATAASDAFVVVFVDTALRIKVGERVTTPLVSPCPCSRVWML